MLAELIVLKGLFTPFKFVFYDLTGAGSLSQSANLPVAFIGQFLTAGLMEELMKMTPALVLIALSSELLRSKLRQWTAVEPLDVILYAAPRPPCS